MSKAKQKQLQALKEQKEKRQNQYRLALKKIIESQQTLRISLDFAEEYLNSPINQPLQEYSPILISRMVFQKQLQQIKKQFEKLPGGESKIQHFIVIMMRVMKFPFEKIPLYMVGLKDMFYEIVQQGKQTISYDKIFKYIVGELVTLKQQQQNTQFQVNFQENKKQDYLLHDNGIKRTLFTNDLKVVMSLDQKQNVIKFYDQEMRNINRYIGKKQNHYGKNPLIIDFDYSQMTMRLGVIYPDCVIESIHLPNYLNKTQNQFQQSSLNLLTLVTCCKMRRIYYMQMLNKWLTISQQNNKVFLYDMQKVRSKPQEVQQKLHIDNNDLNISIVLQIIAISTVCFVAGNQITFYNQSLTQKKFTKFSHHQIINILRYNQENNTFYLVGREEKTITMFTINRSHSGFKIKTFSISKIIVDIEIFPFLDALLVTDQTHQIKLIHQPSKIVYQHQSLINIVKMKDKYIKIQKTSKNSFIVFQTYMLNFTLDKVAIERQIQYNFLPYYHFDSRKDQMYISVNSQIISFSLIYGEIRKNYSLDTSNITKHQCFFIGAKTLPFICDSNNNIYQIYLKSEILQGQNKNYTKKISIREIVSYFYDEQMRTIMLINQNTVNLMRNDLNNNFNTINYIYFYGLSKIVNCTFCTKTKYLTLMTNDQSIYQFRNFENHFSKCFKFTFLRALHDAQQKTIIQYEYCSHYQILILLNNRNEVVLVERLNVANYVIINITDHLPYKFKNLVFSKFSYHLIKQKNVNIPSILLLDDTGYIFDISLQKVVISKFINAKKEEIFIRSFISESYEMKPDQSITEKMVFSPQAKIKLNSNEYVLQKAHQKQIVIASKLFLQIITILTISKDGVIKLWNQKYVILFVLKIPTLLKITWNMKEIQTIKNIKSIKELKSIIHHHYSLKNHQPQFYEAISKNKKLKNYVEPNKKFKFTEEIPLQIESKELQDIILQEEDYKRNFQTSRGLKTKLKYNPELSNTIDVHPWRNRREFVKILQRASPPHKYHDKIPKDLMTLRTSLDMTERKKKMPNYKVAETILPQLRLYQNQKKQEKPQIKKQKQKDEDQTFQSCLYIKTERRRKKPNQFDRIDRQFLRKQIALQNRRRVPKVGRQKISSSIELGESTSLLVDQNRLDTIRDIQSVFQQHNKECTELGRGRIIQIGKINLIKDYL